MKQLLWALGGVLAAPLALAQPVHPLSDGSLTMAPPAVQAVDIDEHLGQAIPANLVFTDSTGATVHLSDYLFKDRPILLVLAYYHCPQLCSLVLSGVVDAIQGVGFVAGKDFLPITVSIDPRETPTLAELLLLRSV